MGRRVEVVGVVLAAGAGTRFAGPTHKLLAELGGRPVIAHVLDAVRAAGFDEVVVVTGAVDLASQLPDDVTVIHNPRWFDGQSTSLQVAVAHAREVGAESIVVGLGDQPGVPSSAWRAVSGSCAPVAVATYDGRLRNPVRLGAEVWDLLPPEGDAGARDLVRGRMVPVEQVVCMGDPHDVDVEEDLFRWS